MRAALQLKHIKSDYIEFIKFSMVGVINTTVDLATYIFLTRTPFLLTHHIVIAKTCSFLVATMSSFILNRRFTFNKIGKPTLSEVMRFYGTVGSGIFINVGVVYFFHSVFGLYDLLAVILATGFSVIWGFAFSKLWVFKNN